MTKRPDASWRWRARPWGAGGLIVLVVALGASASGSPGAVRILSQAGVKNAYPHWSKDGARILYQSNRSGRWHLYIMDRDGRNDVQLTRGEANDNFPDWSPDNRLMAFVSDRDGSEDVFVMSADGSNVRNLTRHAARDIHPYWTPDGNAILFNSTRETDRLQIYEMRPDGTGVHRLVTSPDDDTCARVSPKDGRILYLANLASGHDDILIRDRDGARPVNLTNDSPADGWPTWTPDGERIVFSSRRAGDFSLYVMSAGGGEARRLTNPPEGWFDGRPTVSPDEKWIAFNREKGDTIEILVTELPPP